MPLLEALLTEGYRDPRDVYIALRTDGQKGSGTIVDPFDGGARTGQLLSASLSLDRKEVIFSTPVAHGYSPNQSVAILDVSGPSAGSFNATFSIVVLTEHDFKITLGSVPTDPPGNVDNLRCGSLDSALSATLSHDSTLSEFMEVTVTTAVNHSYANGDTVQIADAMGTGASWFNRTFLIYGVPLPPLPPNQFKYKLTKPGVPTSGADGQTVTSTRIHPIAARLAWPVAKVTTAPGHDYLMNEIVKVDGAGDPIFDGEVFVLVSVANTFYYRIATVPASDASYTGVSCARIIYRFDEVMRLLGENTAIHIGPGVFETRGFDPGRSEQINWTIRAGQKIVGSGMGVTTLKLMFAIPYVPSVTSQQLTVAIGHGPFTPPYVSHVDDFEISDLTVDCNMRSQVAVRVAKAAIAAYGKHVRIRRVRAVDYSTQSFPVECFVITTAGAHPGLGERVDCRIEDCILEQPNPNGLYTITGLLLAAGERPDTGETGWHRACALRNNYANFEYVDNPVSIASITIASGIATVTTRTKHGREVDVNDWVVISGALVNGSEVNTCNGSYKITPVDDYSFTYQPGWPAPVTNPAGEMWVGRYSSRFLAIAELKMASIPSRIVTIVHRPPSQSSSVELRECVGRQGGWSAR